MLWEAEDEIFSSLVINELVCCAPPVFHQRPIEVTQCFIYDVQYMTIYPRQFYRQRYHRVAMGLITKYITFYDTHVASAG
jgi:hypothetical protein